MEKTKTTKFYISLIGAALGVALTFVFVLVEKFKNRPSPSSNLDLIINVADASKRSPLGGVTLNISSGDLTFEGITDDSGILKTTLPPSFQGQTISVRYSKQGYKSFDQIVFVPSTSPDLKPLQPFQVFMEPFNASPDRYTQTFHSGPVPSGRGREFSQWYAVAADPPKSGYEIDLEKSYYSLSGDRQCNSWSECSWAARTPGSLEFQFRLQGHSEWPSPGQALTDGILHVEYKLKK